MRSALCLLFKLTQSIHKARETERAAIAELFTVIQRKVKVTIGKLHTWFGIINQACNEFLLRHV